MRRQLLSPVSRPLALAALLVAALSPRTSFAAEDDDDAADDAAKPIVAPSPPAPASPSPSESPTSTRWYGWQTLLTDGASVVVGLGTHSPAAFAVGYFGGGPIVHFAHGHVAKGVASLVLRFAGPAVGALTGYAVDTATSSPCTGDGFCFRGLGGFLIGGFVGYAGAVVVDAAVLAREEVPAAAIGAPPAPPTGVRWQPMFGVTRTGASGGVGGVF